MLANKDRMHGDEFLLTAKSPFLRARAKRPPQISLSNNSWSARKNPRRYEYMFEGLNCCRNVSVCVCVSAVFVWVFVRKLVIIMFSCVSHFIEYNHRIVDSLINKAKPSFWYHKQNYYLGYFFLTWVHVKKRLRIYFELKVWWKSYRVAAHWISSKSLTPIVIRIDRKFNPKFDRDYYQM